MKRTIQINNDEYKPDLNNPVVRYKNNPILTCNHVNRVWDKPHLKTITVHNSGVTEYVGNTLMLFRSHLRNGISVIGKAISNNGIDNWKISSGPFLKPCSENDNHSSKYKIEELIENEAGGVEDPRITQIDGSYFITYSAYHAKIQNKVRVSLAVTNDFEKLKRFGPVVDIDMRNVVLFSEKINGKYVALFRPNDNTSDDTGGIFSEIKIGYSDKIKTNNWELEPEPIMKQLGGPSAFSDKIGPGAPPIKTKHGWINIFHGVRKTMDGNPYVLGVALHELNNPKKVKVANIPILFPSKADCKVNEDDYVHVPNVVFTCGAIRKNDGAIFIYYGGNDTVMNLAITHEDILAELCNKYLQDPLTGEALYGMME
nr:glycosidase [Bacteroidota bacterium]